MRLLLINKDTSAKAPKTTNVIILIQLSQSVRYQRQENEIATTQNTPYMNTNFFLLKRDSSSCKKIHIVPAIQSKNLKKATYTEPPNISFYHSLLS